MESQQQSLTWADVLAPVLHSSTYESLKTYLAMEGQKTKIYPPEAAIFRAFQLTPFEDVKVVILGQDPYHGEGQANGLSFSVNRGQALPPSLRNIYQELEADLNIKTPVHGDLTAWAKEGVLLLNSVLTVEAGKANSHRGKGWELLTDQVIEALNEREERIVYILWGNAAKKKGRLIDTQRHATVSSVHPSPLSAYRGFFGSKPFSKANQLLQASGQKPIDWRLPA